MQDYKDSRLWLMQGDCFERMKEIPDGSIDMFLTDPPYEISNSGGGMMDRDNRDFIREINSMGMCVSNFSVSNFLTLISNKFKSKQNFNGVFFCSTKQVGSYINYAVENNLQYGIGVWHKTNPAPLCNNKYLSDLEYWVYIKGNKARIGGSYETKSLLYQSKSNVADKKLYGHPTIKPLDLVEKFIINHTQEDMLIADPFMGSGTTGVACQKLKRRFVGIELDTDNNQYFDVAKNRILTVKE